MWVVYASILYLILSYQVFIGFPPFYKKRKKFGFFLIEMPSKREVLDGLVFLGGGMVGGMLCIVIAESSGMKVLAFIGLLPPMYSGWSLRKMLKAETDGPLPWVYNAPIMPFIYPFVRRWPMIYFDLWTMCIPVSIGLIVLIRFIILK